MTKAVRDRKPSGTIAAKRKKGGRGADGPSLLGGASAEVCMASLDQNQRREDTRFALAIRTRHSSATKSTIRPRKSCRAVEINVTPGKAAWYCV